MKITTRVPLLTAGLATLALFTADHAHGQTMRPLQLTVTGSHDTQISGTAATRTTLMAPADHVISGITFAERMDHPCYIQIRTWSRTVASGNLGPRGASTTGSAANYGLSVTFDECGGQAHDARHAFLPDPLAQNRAVRSLKICSRASNERLKGITVWGAQIDNAGSTRDDGITDVEERVNCNEPERRVGCPNGQVARGLHIEHRPSGNRVDIIGLSLVCGTAQLVAQ